MRGSTASFWKKYERQQTQMVAACMPRAAAGYGPFMVQTKKQTTLIAATAKQA